jgi:hypothetical protein
METTYRRSASHGHLRDNVDISLSLHGSDVNQPGVQELLLVRLHQFAPEESGQWSFRVQSCDSGNDAYGTKVVARGVDDAPVLVLSVHDGQYSLRSESRIECHGCCLYRLASDSKVLT